jgi:hypothetical protein
VTINALDDLPPQLDIRLEGIGTAITPQARIPVRGKIEDDYGIQKAWFQVNLSEKNQVYRLDFTPAAGGEVDETLDLRRQQAAATDAWQLAAGEKLVLSVRASDHFDLTDQPHEGQSDDVPLDVVTPDELLALLEARELSLKRRFEQTLAELIETRDSLLKLQAELEPTTETDTTSTSADDSAKEQPPTGDASEPVTDATDDADRLSTLRRLRVQRAQQQAAKSEQEVAGVAASFAQIRDELINNRVDTPERKDRLQTKIVAPLEAIVGGQYPGWLAVLGQLEHDLDMTSAALPLTRSAVQQTNELILALQEVLDNMLELETFNELLDLVRSIIQEQDEIRKDTDEVRKQQARRLLEELGE